MVGQGQTNGQIFRESPLFPFLRQKILSSYVSFTIFFTLDTDDSDFQSGWNANPCGARLENTKSRAYTAERKLRLKNLPRNFPIGRKPTTK